MLIFQQIVSGLAFYAALVALTRLAGKRLAGQTTTFDLIVLISIATATQGMLLGDDWISKTTFLITVFTAHKLLAAACTRSRRLRELVRASLVRWSWTVVSSRKRCAPENVSRDELLAGLRRLGFEEPGTGAARRARGDRTHFGGGAQLTALEAATRQSRGATALGTVHASGSANKRQ